MAKPILEVRDLVTGFDTDAGRVVAVDGVSLSVAPGQTLGVVGESGCGKSVTAFSITQLLPQPHGKILGGSIWFEGRDLASVGAEVMADLRGREMAMIFQEPMTALNPVQTVGRQLAEAIRLHEDADGGEVLRRSVEMLERVRIPAPLTRLGEYPHQLSGGMRQRVMIAMALIHKPKLLIADEPTTALDVTVQAQILALIADLQKEMGMAVLLITHDLGVIAETCDEVAVMYAGRVVERASVGEIFAKPRHAYTRGLLASLITLESEPKSLLPTIAGSVPAIQNLLPGCRFAERSGREHSEDQLRVRPELIEVSPAHWVEACPVCVGEIDLGTASSNAYNDEHEARSERTPAPSLGDALAYLERGGGASGAASKDPTRAEQRIEQLRCLASYARSVGRLISPEKYLRPITHGAEHRVFYDEGIRRAVKITQPNSAGMTFADGQPVAALPTEYLQRWIWHNELFGDDVEWIGVLDGLSGISIVVSQRWVMGEPPAEEQIHDCMRDFGFEPTANPHDYFREEDGMAVLDCHESNLILGEDGELYPIDVIPVKADPELLRTLEVVEG